MNVARLISFAHLGLAAYGLLSGDLVLFLLNILCFGIMNNSANIQDLDTRLKVLEGTDEQVKKES